VHVKFATLRLFDCVLCAVGWHCVALVRWHIHDLTTQVQMFAISTLFQRDDKEDEHLLSTHRQWRVTEWFDCPGI